MGVSARGEGDAEAGRAPARSAQAGAPPRSDGEDEVRRRYSAKHFVAAHKLFWKLIGDSLGMQVS